ncbi:site-specific integrase [Rhodospirillaceae bacterium KN72]|uniref:Site-specific integrase n=1 Tax=Pacificispira spongiicola TaxID=2729598 RepID=A0A7Y0E3K0_9PROT|nr:site-specific integrase [Pacificispira spongiicola]NMM46559.1 site-specific integrase [Pacificispira spongiicola]
MASIRKRSWETRKGETKEAWVVDYFDQHGKRHLKTFTRKKDAEAWSIEARHEVKQGTHTAASESVTVRKAGELWFETCEESRLERSTLHQYRTHLDYHIYERLADTKLSDLNTQTVREFETWLHKNGRSDALVRKALSSLGSILADAQDRGLVSRNVVRERRRRKRNGDRQHEKILAGKHFPTQEEARLILAAASGRWRPLIIAAIFTGMRASELRGLTWDDVDFDASVIHVRQRASLYNELGAPKSKAGRRSIPMGSYLANTLREWKLVCPRRNVKKDADGNVTDPGQLFLVFPNGAGNVENHSNVYRRGFAATQIEAGVSVSKVDDDGAPILDDDGQPVMEAKYGIHAFRHYAISTWIDLGYPHKRIQDIAGHATLSMTMDTYGHLFPNPEADADLAHRAETRLIG